MISRVTSTQFDQLSSGLELDLVAVFALAQEQCLELLEVAEKEGWSTERLNSEMEIRFGVDKENKDENPD
jgi:hypothetical protein